MLSIGKLSQATGVKVPTIRYHEWIGLLPEAGRSAGNQRLYDRKARERPAFIRHARELGFGLDALRDLLSLTDRPDRPSDAAVEARIERLDAPKVELERRVARCVRGRIADCRVIETLADHALRATDHARPAIAPAA